MIVEKYDLCMLEHLSYMNVDDGLRQYVNSGEEYKLLEQCETVEEYLNQFDTDSLRKQGNKYTSGDGISCNEYAAIIDYMRDNNDIKALIVNKENSQKGKPLAYDFEYGDEHIVIFKGTTGGEEWEDNVKGVEVADTPSQIKAKNFIDGINCSNVTVVGHSKGGNKAMYCTIVCDNVKRCVSMDGQGFSDEFIEKYEYNIIAKAEMITNISYFSDFVHGIMIQIPGSIQEYTGVEYGGNGVNSTIECHSPNSLFSYSVDDNGNLQVTGNFEYGEEVKSVQIINGLTEYIMHSDCENKAELIAYLSEIVGKIGENKEVFLNRFFNKEEKVDTDKLTTLAAYLVKYCNEKDITAEEVWVLLLDLHFIDGSTVWNFGPHKLPTLNILKFIFGYCNSNEEDQNYVLAKGAALWIRITGNKEEKVIASNAMAILFKIKKKYKSIHYNASKKKVIFTDKIKKVGKTLDLHETMSADLYYKPEMIQCAISKMQEAMISELAESTEIQTTLSGNALNTCVELNKLYDELYTDVYTLIRSTQQRISIILDAVNALESQ